MAQFMAADIAALFKNEMTVPCVIGGKTIQVILNDLQSVEIDNYGGPEDSNLQQIHILTSDIPELENGIEITVNGKVNILVSNITSADGNEIIATIRGA